MNLLHPNKLTETASVAQILRQANDLSDHILSAVTPDVHAHRALHGIAALGAGSGLFTLSDHHNAALARLPEPLPRGRVTELLPPLPLVAE